VSNIDYTKLDAGLKSLQEVSDRMPVPFHKTIAASTADEIVFDLVQGVMPAKKMQGNDYYKLIFCDGITGGAVFQWHSHPENEYVIVVQGGFIMELEGGLVERFEQFGVCHIKSNVIHQCTVDDGSILIGITVPPSKDY
jgi:hypothetical protein